MRTLTAVLVLALSFTAAAQTTWHNVHFGETRDQVRSELQAQGFPVEQSQDGSLQSTSDYNILLPGTHATIPLRADFHFTDAGALTDVTLTLDLPGMRQTYPNFAGDLERLQFAYEHFNRALTDKYGVPLSISPDCTADGAVLAKIAYPTCAVNFRDAAQSIELGWGHRPGRLYIRYQMLASDL